MKALTISGLALLAGAVFTASVSAQDKYPSKPITMIVPFAAGGSSDVIARLAGDEMGRILGQRIVMENMGGAGGATALTRAARAETDGYTIVIGNSGTNAASYSIYPDLKYTHADFAPVGLVAKTSPMIAIKLDFPAKTLLEFVDYAKKNPGKVTLGHAGVGSSNYLICRAFIKAAGVGITLVSYRGAGPALNDLMGGQIDGVCDAATSLSGSVQAEKVKALVVATPNRLESLPNVPTSKEAGLPSFQAQGWNAIFVPKGTPEPIVARLNEALRTALASPALQSRFKDLSSVVPNQDEMAPAFVASMLPGEIEKYRLLLQDK